MSNGYSAPRKGLKMTKSNALAPPELGVRSVMKVPLDDREVVKLIIARMGELNLRQRDLAPILGGTARVSEVLAGKRRLTLRMVRAVHRHLGIPASDLLASRERYVMAWRSSNDEE